MWYERTLSVNARRRWGRQTGPIEVWFTQAFGFGLDSRSFGSRQVCDGKAVAVLFMRGKCAVKPVSPATAMVLHCIEQRRRSKGAGLVVYARAKPYSLRNTSVLLLIINRVDQVSVYMHAPIPIRTAPLR